MSAEQDNEDAYGKELAAISSTPERGHERAVHGVPSPGRRRDRTRAGGRDHSRALRHLILE